MSDQAEIELKENGPLMVRNVGRMVGPDGHEIEVKAAMALCRCGYSGNKPFCDGSHKKQGWSSD
ncbi:CDGSH iron-sulfur domain-containing protein [Roseovarius salis]|uniref:CDGSH iron-sulfur domain-containing protein n=1 Tax=Roseovarius salis TaxID=3376063 RepID=UPI0037C51EF6